MSLQTVHHLEPRRRTVAIDLQLPINTMDLPYRRPDHPLSSPAAHQPGSLHPQRPSRPGLPRQDNQGRLQMTLALTRDEAMPKMLPWPTYHKVSLRTVSRQLLATDEEDQHHQRALKAARAQENQGSARTCPEKLDPKPPWLPPRPRHILLVRIARSSTE